MALKIFGKELFANIDAKSRIFLLFTAVVGISLLAYIGVRYMSGGAAPTGPSTVANAPKGLVSVPGSELTPQYYRALEQANVQAAAQAKITRTSAVPTLMNVQGGGGGSQNCTVLCPSEENVNVADDIAALVNDNKLSKEDAAHLLDLAAKNVSVDEYAAALDALVKAGKLTPEQARLLLEKYKKQHENALLKESASVMDAMIKAGQLPLDTATELLDLQKRHLTPAEYAAELARLVKEGKISPEEAARLLAQYTQQMANETAKNGVFAMDQMVKNGEMTAETAAMLKDLQNKKVPLSQYQAVLDQLVSQGKLTPAAAKKLAELYMASRTSSSGILAGLMAKGGPYADLARKLLEDQANNVTLQQYADDLKNAVTAGLLTPEEAAELLRQYQAMLLPVFVPAGTTPGAETNIPNVQFEQLRQRVQSQNTGAPVEVVSTTQFNNPPPNQAQAQASQDRMQRLQAIQAGMAGQAQSLVSAWATPTMAHREGSWGSKEKSAEGATTVTTTTSKLNQTEKGTTVPSSVLIKAGTIYFGILDTAVDSDYPDTPVLVTIIDGPFKGAKLLGKLSLAQGKDKVSLNFNLMDTDEWVSAKSISAFAIDPDTARTVLASNVDRHYLEKYGAIMATSFLSGYAGAITQAGTSTTGIFGTSTSHPELSPSSKLAVAIGQIGTNLSSVVAANINIPTTVKVNSGVGLGILFVNEVTTG